MSTSLGDIPIHQPGTMHLSHGWQALVRLYVSLELPTSNPEQLLPRNNSTVFNAGLPML